MNLDRLHAYFIRASIFDTVILIAIYLLAIAAVVYYSRDTVVALFMRFYKSAIFIAGLSLCIHLWTLTTDTGEQTLTATAGEFAKSEIIAGTWRWFGAK